jgi:hypothetical protein
MVTSYDCVRCRSKVQSFIGKRKQPGQARASNSLVPKSSSI